jgi:DNA-binding response OmpR family regulator
MTSNRLLIIDPDAGVTATLKIYFEGHNYEVKAFHSGSEGIFEAQAWQPNAVLINDYPADKPVAAICRELIEHPLTGHIPVLLLLSATDRRAKLEALEIGVTDIISRPYDIEELRLRIETAIRFASYYATNE